MTPLVVRCVQYFFGEEWSRSLRRVAIIRESVFWAGMGKADTPFGGAVEGVMDSVNGISSSSWGSWEISPVEVSLVIWSVVSSTELVLAVSKVSSV